MISLSQNTLLIHNRKKRFTKIILFIECNFFPLVVFVCLQITGRIIPRCQGMLRPEQRHWSMQMSKINKLTTTEASGDVPERAVCRPSSITIALETYGGALIFNIPKKTVRTEIDRQGEEIAHKNSERKGKESLDVQRVPLQTTDHKLTHFPSVFCSVVGEQKNKN